jgi:hypothetical protein
MSDPNYKANRMSLNSFNRTTLSVFAAVAAAIFVIGAIYTYNNSIGSDTSGDDTRPVVNNAPPAAAAPSHTALTSPTTPSPATPSTRP